MKLALAGDAMLGRKVGDALRTQPPESLVSEEVVAVAREADLFVLNLECCISTRGSPWPDPAKPFHFRAPPAAVHTLTHLGVSCVTLANNHALDFGPVALLETLEHLAGAGIASTGAGPDLVAARIPAVLDAGGLRVAVVGVTDHPHDFAAASGRPGVAYADLRRGVPDWLRRLVAAQDADVVVVTPHWGPNMTAAPVPHVRAAAPVLLDAGATLVAGHSAHVFHGVEGRVLYDLGDLLEDYAVDTQLRNDLGLLFLVELAGARPVRVEAVPLALDYCSTRLADAAQADWIARRFTEACAAFGTEVRGENDRLAIAL
jgi:poly-gamma-glutamate capsule biosynthesis protein CapA/YwtB (metallophosphatase superfamily)